MSARARLATAAAPAFCAWLAVALATARAALPDTQPCPERCACNYSRIFWETDCARLGLAATPDGLSPDSYSLDLTGNKLTKLGPFPAGCRLRKLLASENLLTSVSSEDLAGLDLLVEVNLSQNQITKIDPGAFRTAAGLLTLVLANNMLEAPESALIASDSLKNLDLRGNRLHALPAGTFANCSSLGTLDLSDNPLEALSAAALAPLTGLETLTVARCGLEALDPEALAPLAQLKTLDASGNHLGVADRWAPALRKLARLDALTLEEAALEGPLPSNSFAQCASLRRVAMSGNPELRDPWPAAAALANLVELEVRGCGLSELAPAPLRANLSSLRLLDASNNALGPALPPGSLALPALVTLRLARCGLQQPMGSKIFQEESEGEAEQVEPALEELSLAGNPLRLRADGPLLPAAAQGALRTLDLSNSSLRELPAVVLRGANNLTELRLHDNPIQEVPEKVLHELPSLSILDLRSCLLRSIYARQLSSSPRLRTLRLSGNPWVCGCALRLVWAWAVQGKGDLAVLEGAHNLTCTPDGGDASDAVRWEEVASDQSNCPEQDSDSKSVRRAAPLGTAEFAAAPSRSLGSAFLVPAGTVAAILGVAALLLGVTAKRRRWCHIEAKIRRQTAP